MAFSSAGTDDCLVGRLVDFFNGKFHTHCGYKRFLKVIRHLAEERKNARPDENRIISL